MSIRTRGKSYQVRVPGFPDQSVAKYGDAVLLDADRKKQKAMGHLYQAPPTTLGYELDCLLEKKRSMGGRRGQLTPRGLEFYEQSVKGWKDLRGVLVPSLRLRLVEPHVQARARVAPVAARNEIQVMKQALRDAEARGQRVDPALFDLVAPTHRSREGIALSFPELNRLADVMPDRLRCLPLFIGSVGLRFMEAFRLDDSMIDLNLATLQIPTELNKSRRPKPVRLARYELELIEAQMKARVPNDRGLLFPTLSGSVYSTSGFQSVWTAAIKKAELPGLRFHDLRHTAISLMAMAGMRVEIIARRVGHNDGGALILRRYRHLFDIEVTDAVSLVDALADAARTRALADGRGVVSNEA